MSHKELRQIQETIIHSTHYRSFWGRFHELDDPNDSAIALKDNGKSHPAQATIR